MVTLLIEHPISDYPTWRQAYDRFADTRRAAGVQQARVHRPVDDPAYVIITLDFADVGHAEAFRQVLRTRIWADPSNAPALRGEPRTAILDLAE
jgi:hypothetical protein